MAEKSKSKLGSFLSRYKVWVIIGIVILLAGGGGFIYYRSTQAKQTSETAAMQTATAHMGDLSISASGTGTLIPADEAYVGFDTSGKVEEVFVSLGDIVEAGQLLAVLDDTDAKAQLREAKQTLLDLTSAASIAQAQQAVATAQQDAYEAQVAYNSVVYWYDDALYQNAYATLVLARENLNKAQERYNSVAGEGEDDPDRAWAYKELYAAQTAYDTAQYYVNLYKAKPTDRTVAEKKAALDLAEATLEEAQNYLAALTGGEVPEGATGNALEQLRLAQENVKAAEETVEATNLYAPIPGTIMWLSIGVGDAVGTGSVITIDDLSIQKLDVYLDESDWDKIVVGYTAEVTFDALPDTTYTGKVISVDPGLYTQGMTSAIHGVVELDPTEDFKLLVGMSASVEVISAEAKNAVLIPIEALHEITAGQYAVFVVENGEPVMRTVEVGILDSYYAEIKSGLQAGEVVTTGIVETQ
jgi:HlyD family secretion protein